jgi:hypothetical protein
MKYVAGLLALCTMSAFAQVPISGTVESKCVITTDTDGVYGNPTPSKLSTASADGGVVPIVRFDVVSADYYKARITYPIDFSSSPELLDTVNWSGAVTVGEVSNAEMAAYETAKVEFNNTVEFDLTLAGSTWFKIDSEADYGYDKAFPAGTYNAVVEAECIAK